MEVTLKLLRVLEFSLLLALLCGVVSAQETWGSIRGTVTDPSGAAVPGAQLELSGAAMPRPMTATSDATGVFRFAQTPAATGYTLTVSLTGFRTTKAAGINVELGKATTVDLKLEVGQVTESVVVSGAGAMVDTQSSSSAVTVDRSFFDQLPKGRSFYDLINIAPGARNESKENGFQIDGASGSENVYFLDGQDVTGIQQGTLSAQNRIPNEMIQQIEIKNGLMEAQYGGAMGGVVNAVLRSGTNGFHGQAGFYFNNSAMQARPRASLALDPFNDDKALYTLNPGDSYTAWSPILRLGGPMIKNKLFFFSSYEPTKTETDRTVTFTNKSTNSFHRREVQQFLANKLDFQPASRFRINGSWLWNPNRVTSLLPVYAGTDDPSNPWSQLGNRTSNSILHGEIVYLATSKLIVSFGGGYNHTNYNSNYGVPLTTAIYYGTSNIGMAGIPAELQHASGWLKQANPLIPYDTYDKKSYTGSVSYMGTWHGQHDIKGGWQMNQLSNEVMSTTYANGYYRFYWNSNYTCAASCTGKMTGTDGYYRYRILGTIGNAASDNQGLFLQDNWKVNRRLTLNLGLRTEHEFVPGFVSGNSAPAPAITFGWQQKLSPRIGGAWDITGKGKQKLYASWGIFYDVMKYELPRGSFGGDVWKDFFYSLDDPSLVPTLTAKGFVNMTSNADSAKLPGKYFEMINWRIPSNDPAQNLIDPNLKPMQQRMFDLGYEYMLTDSLVASARYTDRRLVRAIEDTGTMTTDGELYFVANPSEGITTGTTWAKHWGPGIPVPPKPVRNYDALELRLDKRFSSRYQFAFSYTLSRLYGNYSGLASSDEADANGVGRSSPNVNRYYDEPWVGITQSGQYPQGRLATDRPHTFKLFGVYTLKSKLGSTTFSPNISAYSGTPNTTELPIVTSTPAFPFGRGDMGRTPFFFNTDFNIQHEILPSKSHEQLRVRLELGIFNLFNSATATDLYKTIAHQNDVGSTGIAFDNYADAFKGWDARGLMKAQGIRVDPEYGLPTQFQSPRQLRLQMSFFF
jgi:outer membrane receptor protein involved in Fe transport